VLVFPAVDEMPSAERKITRVKITRAMNMRRRKDREDRERFGGPKGEHRRGADEPILRNIP
jgi:hypothetical protein